MLVRDKFTRFGGSVASPFFLAWVIFCFFTISAIAEEMPANVKKALDAAEQQMADKMTKPPKPATDPSPDVVNVLEQKTQQIKEQKTSREPRRTAPDEQVLQRIEKEGNKQLEARQGKKKPRFSTNELLLDLPPDSVLATANGDPLVYADEFNHRVKPAYGEDLFQARYTALKDIINNKLVAQEALAQGYEKNPYVKSRTKKAEDEVEAKEKSAQFMKEISDTEAQRYYEQNRDKFRKPDRGTRVLFAVKADREQAASILTSLKKGEPFEHFSYLKEPLPGSQLPHEVQEALFNLQPGEVTDVVQTPIGFYVARLVERNPFDHFKVSVIVRNNEKECREVMKKIQAGARFEDLVESDEHLSMDAVKLPEEVRSAIEDMDLNEISRPVNTPFGTFLVKMQERWSDAKIVTAKLIRVNSKEKGEELLAGLKKGQKPGPGEERQISGGELPAELKDMGKTFRLGEYGGPVKTAMGYYLLKVTDREIERYRPFSEVKENVKQIMRGEKISGRDALQYYINNQKEFQRPAPVSLVKVILAESADQGKKILDELKKTPEGEKRDALFAQYQDGLKEEKIPEFRLPAECRDEIDKLKPGQLSPVLNTRLGHFIVLVQHIEDPSFDSFDEVKDKIRITLADKMMKEGARETKREAEILMKTAREDALKTAFYRNYISQVKSVSDEEAEQWWLQNREDFFKALGMPVQEKFVLENEEKTRLFKKSNALLTRYRALVDDLNAENNVVIFENMLY